MIQEGKRREEGGERKTKKIRITKLYLERVCMSKPQSTYRKLPHPLQDRCSKT